MSTCCLSFASKIRHQFDGLAFRQSSMPVVASQRMKTYVQQSRDARMNRIARNQSNVKSLIAKHHFWVHIVATTVIFKILVWQWLDVQFSTQSVTEATLKFANWIALQTIARAPQNYSIHAAERFAALPKVFTLSNSFFIDANFSNKNLVIVLDFHRLYFVCGMSEAAMSEGLRIVCVCMRVNMCRMALRVHRAICINHKWQLLQTGLTRYRCHDYKRVGEFGAWHPANFYQPPRQPASLRTHIYKERKGWLVVNGSLGGRRLMKTWKIKSKKLENTFRNRKWSGTVSSDEPSPWALQALCSVHRSYLYIVQTTAFNSLPFFVCLFQFSRFSVEKSL